MNKSLVLAAVIAAAALAACGKKEEAAPAPAAAPAADAPAAPAAPAASEAAKLYLLARKKTTARWFFFVCIIFSTALGMPGFLFQIVSQDFQNRARACRGIVSARGVQNFDRRGISLCF